MKAGTTKRAELLPSPTVPPVGEWLGGRACPPPPADPANAQGTTGGFPQLTALPLFRWMEMDLQEGHFWVSKGLSSPSEGSKPAAPDADPKTDAGKKKVAQLAVKEPAASEGDNSLAEGD